MVDGKQVWSKTIPNVKGINVCGKDKGDPILG